MTPEERERRVREARAKREAAGPQDPAVAADREARLARAAEMAKSRMQGRIRHLQDQHNARLARLQRIEALARAAGDQASVERVRKLIERENSVFLSKQQRLQARAADQGRGQAGASAAPDARRLRSQGAINPERIRRAEGLDRGAAPAPTRDPAATR
jgi:hypothetical protein